MKIQPKSLYTGFYSDLNGHKLNAVSTLYGSNSVLHTWPKTPVNSYEYNTKKCLVIPPTSFVSRKMDRSSRKMENALHFSDTLKYFQCTVCQLHHSSHITC